MMPLWKQKIGGVLIALFSGGGNAWMWYTALTKGYFYPFASVVFPAFCITGLGLMLFPGYKQERIAKGEDISRLVGIQLITFRWWIIMVLALVTGFINYAMISMS